MFKVRRTAPLSRVEYVTREREREKGRRITRKKKTTNGFFSHAIRFFDFHYNEQTIVKSEHVIENKKEKEAFFSSPSSLPELY
jgi:hypothetical protein